MKVTLKTHHRHEDKVYAEGETLDVPEHDARWMQANGVIDDPRLKAKAGAKPDTAETKR